MERPIHTKFDIYFCKDTVTNNTYTHCHQSAVSGASHISQIGNWGLEHMEHTIPTKMNVYACMLTLNNTTKNYYHRSAGSGTSHISQIGKLLS